MKLHEIANPKEEKTTEEEPAFFRRQAGPVLSKYERKEVKRKIKSGKTPMFLKRQAESVELTEISRRGF